MFHTSFGTIENGEVTIVGVSIKAYDVGDKWASIEGERGRWLQKASGRAENVYPEFDLIFGGLTSVGRAMIKSLFQPNSTTNTNEFAHEKTKKGGKLKGAKGDNHAKQYTHGGKKRPKNPNQKKGAEERRNKGKTNN